MRCDRASACPGGSALSRTKRAIEALRLTGSPGNHSRNVCTAIEIRNLSKASRIKARQEVRLDVDAGEIVALIGASGSGKSTLLRHIAGFVAADAGEITVFGQAIQQDGRMSASVRRLRAGIGFVFQQFNLVGRLSVMTNVLTGLLIERACGAAC